MPPQSVTSPAATTLTRRITAAPGVFAPGHLGELTRYLPFELVDDVLVQTRTVQQRLRMLPSRTGVYFVLALALFPGIGYQRVWTKLCAGLSGLAGLTASPVSISHPLWRRRCRRRPCVTYAAASGRSR